MLYAIAPIGRKALAPIDQDTKRRIAIVRRPRSRQVISFTLVGFEQLSAALQQGGSKTIRNAKPFKPETELVQIGRIP